MSELVEMVEDSVQRGLPNATLIEWDRMPRLFSHPEEESPLESIVMARFKFERSGWIWNATANQLEKDGWLIWFRSQGQLAPPICQWSRI